MPTKQIRMKTISLLSVAAALWLAPRMVSAQDVIVKKDGSTVLSKVTEVGSAEVKYKKWSNQDGPVYTVAVSEILSINYQNGEKETFDAVTTASDSFLNTSLHRITPIHKTHSLGNGVVNGYKAFIEGGYIIGVGDLGEDRLSLFTTHGYQFNQYLFAGLGVGVNYYHDQDLWNIPIYANVRVNILDNGVTPFVDLKIGYSAADVYGFYLSPSLGCRFRLTNHSAIFASIGYEMQRTKFIDYYFSYNHYYTDEYTSNCGGLSIKIGFEF